MKPPLTALLILCTTPLLAKEYADTISLKNGDYLQGEFIRLDDNGDVLWKRPTSDNLIDFPLKDINMITIDNGKAASDIKQKGVIYLKSGDILPGNVTNLEGDKISVKSEIINLKEFNINDVSSISPSPYGGSLIYFGPTNPEEWEVKPIAMREADIPKLKLDKKAKWEVRGSGLFAKSFKSGVIYNKEHKMPDDVILKFTYAFKSQAPLNLMLLADMDPEQKAKKEAAKKEQAKEAKKEEAPKAIKDNQAGRIKFNNNVYSPTFTFGESYFLTISYSTFNLYECGFNEDGIAHQTRIVGFNKNNHRAQQNNTINDIEIRISKSEGTMHAYMNGIERMEWKLEEIDLKRKGSHFGFYAPANNNFTSPNIRISNIAMSKWHGVNDPIASASHKNKDITILNNGTDRFSGKLISISDNHAHIDGSFAKIKVPLNQVQTINFATDKKEVKDKKGTRPKDNDVTQVFIGNVGLIQGKLLPSDKDGTLKIKTSHSGDISIPINMITRIMRGNTIDILNAWNEKL